MKVMFSYCEKDADSNLYTYDYFKQEYFHPRYETWHYMSEKEFNGFVEDGTYIVEGKVV
jgi:hypothetical protein